MNFHHLGIATDNIDNSINFIKENFEIISYTNKVYDPLQDAELVLIKTKDVNIELVSGLAVDAFIEKRHYHVCYEVGNIDKSIKKFSQSIIVSPPKNAILFNNRKVAFLLTPIGLVELLECKR